MEFKISYYSIIFKTVYLRPVWWEDCIMELELERENSELLSVSDFMAGNTDEMSSVPF